MSVELMIQRYFSCLLNVNKSQVKVIYENISKTWNLEINHSRSIKNNGGFNGTNIGKNNGSSNGTNKKIYEMHILYK